MHVGTYVRMSVHIHMFHKVAPHFVLHIVFDLPQCIAASAMKDYLLELRSSDYRHKQPGRQLSNQVDHESCKSIARNAHTHRQTDRYTHAHIQYLQQMARGQRYCKQFDQQRRQQSELTTYNTTTWSGLDWRAIYVYTKYWGLHFIHIRIYIYIRTLYLKYVHINVHTDRQSVGPQ